MDSIRIVRVRVDKNGITADIAVEGKVKEAFNGKSRATFTYGVNVDLTGLPEGIASVPVLGFLLPIAWVYDAAIHVGTLDREFYESIPDFKRGYINMYPEIDFRGGVTADRLEANEAPKSGALCLFSGGVDATCTALAHADENPVLLTIRSAELRLAKDETWRTVTERNAAFAETLDSRFVAVESNFRAILNPCVLNQRVLKYGDTWWHGFQHGLAILTLAAPVAWQYGIATVYIASSFSAGTRGRITCASDPSIDNFVRYGGTRVVHDGYALTRMDKLRDIAKWCRSSGRRVYLRACSKTGDGNNCCHCEKCWRTLLGLYAVGEDPRQYGFEYEDFAEQAREIHRGASGLLEHFNTRYIPIISAMREHYTEETISDELRWLWNINIPENSEFFDWVNELCAARRNEENEKKLILQRQPHRRVIAFLRRVKRRIKAAMGRAAGPSGG